MSLSKGALDASAAVGASQALAGAVEELREKYAKKAEAERKAAAAAPAPEPAPAPEAEEDAEWLDDPGAWCMFMRVSCILRWVLAAGRSASNFRILYVLPSVSSRRGTRGQFDTNQS